MKRAVFYLALALSVSPALAGSEADTPRDMVLLTVGGLVGKTNRGPVDAKRDVLLAEQKAAFKSAFEFDRAMLLALPQATVTGQPNNFVKHARFSGPVLHALLGYLEAAKLKVTFTALTASPAGLRRRISTAPIVFSHSRPTPFRLGSDSKGPIWLVKRGAQKVDGSDPKHGDWVWNVFYINIGE